MTLSKVVRKGSYQGVTQWGISTSAEITPSRATARKWAELENAQKQTKPTWEVIVGNIGTVYSGTNGFEANTTFQTYVGQSNSGYGRAGGEDVTLMKDGELHRQFEGENGRLPICDDCGGEGTEGCICDDLNDATD
jgi:hypothetical protein